MRSPETQGAEGDHGTFFVQSTFSEGPNLTGGRAAVETPEEFGPRKAGQLSEASAPATAKFARAQSNGSVFILVR